MMNQDSVLQTNLFAYCENNPVNNSDPSGWKKKRCIRISSWVVASAIDLAIIFMNSAVYGSFSATTLTFMGLFKWSYTKQFAIRLIKGAVPAFKGFLRKGLTVIRTVLWRLAGVSLYFLQDWAVTKFFNATKIWDHLSMFLSYGSFAAYFLDLICDNKGDGKITIWLP